MSHQAAIDANIRAFSSAEKYDARESMQLLSILFAKTILEYDSQTDKVSFSGQEYGDPHKPVGGITSAIIDYPASASAEFHKDSAPLNIMDFACGTGLLSENLVPFLPAGSKITGIDINQAFLDGFNLKIDSLLQRDTDVSIETKNLDILDSTKQDLILQFENKFDKIFCTLLYHHLEDYESITKKLVTFLKPGAGHLYIIDFYNEDVERASAQSHAVRHMGGLKFEAISGVFKLAGLESINVGKGFVARIWQHADFIRNHCEEKTIEAMECGKLEKKVSPVDGEVYLIAKSVIVAVGKRAA